MRATEICGEVFLRNMGCFFNRATHRSQCHSLPSGMPHFSVSNATLWHSRSVAFALPKCGIPDGKLWHLFCKTGKGNESSSAAAFLFLLLLLLLLYIIYRYKYSASIYDLMLYYRCLHVRKLEEKYLEKSRFLSKNCRKLPKKVPESAFS